MISVAHTVKKSLLIMLFVMLFVAFSIFCGIVFLAVLQWFMHTDIYLNMVYSAEFWLWVLGIPFTIIFLITCAKL